MFSTTTAQKESGNSRLNNIFYQLGIMALKGAILLSIANSLVENSEACLRRGIAECTVFGGCDNSPPRG